MRSFPIRRLATFVIIVSLSAFMFAGCGGGVTGTTLYTYHAHQLVDSIAWSPDGKYIACGCNGGAVQVWNALTGNERFTYRGPSGDIWLVAWSPDSKRIATGGSDGVQVWDAANTRDPVFTYHGPPASEAPQNVIWSPGGKYIAAVWADGTIQVWDAKDGGRAYTYAGPIDHVDYLAWSPDGKYIASVWKGTVQVWDASTGSHVYTYRGHHVAVIAWSPDSKRIASGGSSDGKVQVWDAKDGGHAPIPSYGENSYSVPVDFIAWSSNGKYIAATNPEAGNSGANVWTSNSVYPYLTIMDAQDGNQVYSSEYGGSDPKLTVRPLAWSPDSKYIAQVEQPVSGDVIVQVWQFA